MNRPEFDFNAPVRTFMEKLPVWTVAFSMLVISSCAAFGTTVLLTKDVWLAINSQSAELDHFKEAHHKCEQRLAELESRLGIASVNHSPP